jgi:YVTN family beta-propeller protein
MRTKHFFSLLILVSFLVLSLNCGKKDTPTDVTPTGDTTPPSVTTSYPVGDTTGMFLRNSVISLTFSEAMKQSSVQSAFSAEGMTGNFFWTGNTVFFVPDSAFGSSDTVWVNVTSSATDLADNGLSPVFNKWFRTSTFSDTAKPVATPSTPAANSVNQPVGTSIVASVNEKLINYYSGGVTLTDSLGNAVTGNISLDSAGTEIYFNPSSDLKYNTRYYVKVDTLFRDLCWNRLADTVSWTFRTVPDTVKPTVISSTPAAGDTNASVNTTVSICFSEPMDHASAQSALSLTPSVSLDSFSWQGDTLMTVTLADTLSFKKSYRINVAVSALDANGNPLATAYSAQFSTMRGLFVLCNAANEIYSYQQPDLKFEGYLRPFSSPRQIRISADDSMAYVLTQNGVSFIQLKNSNNVVGTVNLPQTCYGLALSPNGARLAVTDTLNKWLYIISTSTMLKEDSVQTVAAYPKGVCFNQGSGRLAVLCWGKVEIYSSSLALLYTTIIPNNGEEVALGNGDTLYAASGTGFSTISFADGTKLRTDVTIQSNHPFGLAFSPDGQHLAMACYDENKVNIYNTSGGNVTSVAVGNNPKGLAYSPDGTRLYVTNSAGSSVSVISRSGNSYSLLSAQTITVGAGPWGIAVTP